MDMLSITLDTPLCCKDPWGGHDSPLLDERLDTLHLMVCGFSKRLLKYCFLLDALILF